MHNNTANISPPHHTSVEDRRLDSPSCHRNQAPIEAVLERFLGGRFGHALEVGSGTGQHVVKFAARFSDLVWWPSDRDPASRASIRAWSATEAAPNIRPVRDLDVTAPDWNRVFAEETPLGDLAAIACINVLHIAPWTVACALLSAAGRYLRPDGIVFLYGPYFRAGVATAPGNTAFDATLRGWNAEWGIRSVEEIERQAHTHHLTLSDIIEMPANNLCLIIERL
jgi:SAM-dependent methyltransferase